MSVAPVNLAEEPVAPAPETDPEIVRLHGAPYAIVAWFGQPGNKPERFPMMHLDPAIDAARAIARDGTYYTVEVVDAYTGLAYAQFNRYATAARDGAPIAHSDEAVKQT